MASKTIRRGVGIAALVLLAAAVVWALRPAPVPVETAVVARAPLTARVVAGRTLMGVAMVAMFIS